jgi:hypothetical protein
MKVILEPERKIPVSHEVDVVVCGGGTSGVSAAVCAARMGLKVVMIERTASPGGMAAHVVKSFEDYENKGGFVSEVIEKLKSEGHFNAPWYNPFALVPFFDNIIKEAGVCPLYLAGVTAPIVEDGKLKGVIVESKSGRHAVLSKVVIDATGDGDIAVRSGAEFNMGRDSDGQCQAMSISSMLLNYKGKNISGQELEKIVKNANVNVVNKFKLPFNRSSISTLSGIKNIVWHCIPHVTGFDATDTEELSEAIVELRLQAYSIFKFLNDNCSEFSGCSFGPTSPLPGVRQSRQIICDSSISLSDIENGQKRSDGIFTVTWSMSLHKCVEDDVPIELKPVKPYHVPYSALLPKGLENIFVVGRCIGGCHESLASYRIVCDCFAMGEAVAIAAKLQNEKNSSLRDINVSELQAEMKGRGYLI